MSFQILTDSTCDLIQDYIDKYHIHILPFSLKVNDHIYQDSNSISNEDMFSLCEKCHSLPKALPIKQKEAEEYLNNIQDEVLCIVSSSKLTAVSKLLRFTSFNMQKQKQIHIFDTSNISGGLALLVLTAAEMRENGKSIHQITGTLAELKKRVSSSFLLETNSYLYYGGKCPGITGAINTKLHTRSLMKVEQGKLSIAHKYRRLHKDAVEHYIKDLHASLKHAMADRIIIVYSGRNKKDADMICQYLKEKYYFNEIIALETSYINASQCGPESVGVFFLTVPELS